MERNSSLNADIQKTDAIIPLTHVEETYYYNHNISTAFYLNSSQYKDIYYSQYYKNGGASFFDTYFSRSRFIAETTFACLSAILNASALAIILRTKGFSPYHFLFVNLVAANTVSCILSWITNNSLYLFESAFVDLLLEEVNFCKFFVYLLTGVFSSSSFSIVSLLTILGFLTIQYLAICKPLHHTLLVRKKKVVIFIIATWGVTVILSCLPFVILLVVTGYSTCTSELLSTIIRVVITGANCYIGLVTVIFLATLIMCIRIYFEIHQFHIRLSFFRFQRDPFVQRKTFITSVILLATMTLFFLPYSVIYVVTLNKSDTTEMHNNVLIYYMTLLPYFKYVCDPLIYGLRMSEMQDILTAIKTCPAFRKCNNCFGYNNTFRLSRTPTTQSQRPIRLSSVNM